MNEYKVRYVPKVKLEPEKYMELLSGAVYTNPYSHWEYLDLVTPKWDALVWGDYDAVMPLPYARAKRYLWRMKILQPMFCQQLGIFSKIPVNGELFRAFIHEFLMLNPKTYAFHSGLTPLIKDAAFPQMHEKTNYVLDLNADYNDLRAGYSTNAKRNIAKARRQQYEVVKDVPVEDFLRLKKLASRHRISRKVWRTMERIIRYSGEWGAGYSLGVRDAGGQWQAVIFLLTGSRRLVHLVSASGEMGKKNGAMSLLFDSIIEEYAGQKKILDFEGSGIPGVARFFQSFGAVNEPYYVYSNL